MKRNRVKYGIYNYKDLFGTKIVYSKFQMKKFMKKMETGCAFKIRLVHCRDGGCGWWNMQHSYACWTVGI